MIFGLQELDTAKATNVPLFLRKTKKSFGVSCSRPRWINDYYRIVVRTTTDLMLLGTRANPKKEVARKKRVELLDGSISLPAPKIDDYLNWFEATQSQTRSGAFAEYLKAAGKSHDPEPRRRDPISVYLDVLEAQFQ